MVRALVAGAASAQVALLAGAGLLVLVSVTVRWSPLHPAMGRLDRTPVSYWPEPAPAFEPLPDDGPVRVVKTYRVSKENVPRFLDATERVGRSRRRPRLRRGGRGTGRGSSPGAAPVPAGQRVTSHPLPGEP